MSNKCITCGDRLILNGIEENDFSHYCEHCRDDMAIDESGDDDAGLGLDPEWCASQETQQVLTNGDKNDREGA